MKISQVPQYSLKTNYIFSFSTFLENFYHSNDKGDLLIDEPIEGILEPVEYCKLAAAAQRLANIYNIPIPSWVMSDKYFMPNPVYAFGTIDKEYQELLIATSFEEYKIRNLYFGDGVLRRV